MNDIFTLDTNYLLYTMYKQLDMQDINESF